MTQAGLGSDRNLGDVFARHAGDDRIAVVDLFDPGRPREFGFDAFDARINGVAAGLVASGLGPGDRIANRCHPVRSGQWSRCRR